jgi:hypothetical protein
MAKKEEIQAKNIAEANELLADQINLVSNIQDKMAFLVKLGKEKTASDKFSLDIIKQTTNQARNLSSEFESLKDVQKEISKFKKNENDIQKQLLALQKQGGQNMQKELSDLKVKQESLSKAQAKLADMESKKKQGKFVDEALLVQARKTLEKKEEQLKVADETLSLEGKQVLLLQEASNAAQMTAEHLNEQLRRQENLNKSSTLFTATLTGANKALDKMGFGGLSKKLGLDAASKKAKDLTYELTDGGKKSLGVFGKMRVGIASFGAAFKSALGPMALIGIATSLFAKFKEQGQEAAAYMAEVNTQTVNLTRELGVSASVGAKVAGSARAIGGAMGMTGEQAVAASSAIYSQLSGAEELGASTMKTFMKLNVHGNVSTEVLGKIHKISKLTGQEAGHVAEEIASQAQESIKTMKVNVSMKAVMEGVSKVSSRVALNFKGSGTAITSAVVQAKKLGLEMAQVEDIANSLLNIEDSIAAEMEAELLTGKDLNLEIAREAALNGDNAKLMEELANQGITAAEFSNMNRIQQDALGKSLGMNGDSLADMLSNQKESEASNTNMVDSQQDAVAAMTSMASLAEAITNQENARLASMAPVGGMFLKFQAIMKDIAITLQPILNALFTELGNIFFPILEGVRDWLKDSGNVEKITNGIKNTFAGIKEFVTPIFEMLGKLAQNLMPVLEAIWLRIQPVIYTIRDTIASVVLSIGSLLEKLATGNGEFTTMEKIIYAIGIGLIAIKGTMLAIKGYRKAMVMYEKTSLAIEKGKNIILGIQMGYQAAMGGMEQKRALLEQKGLVKSIGTAIMKVVSSLASIPVVGWVLGLAAAGTIAALGYKYMNDGVVPPSSGGGGYGDRVMYGPEGAISFNNKDTIVAGTNLFGNESASNSASGGGGAMVAELQRVSALLQAILSKEGGVYIDGNKVGTTLALSNYKQQ